MVEEGEWKQLRNAASSWSLANDNQLLGLLEKSSRAVFANLGKIDAKLDETLERVDKSEIQFRNSQGAFLALANTQFVENRVYDEDDATISAQNKKDENVPQTEADSLFNSVKQSLLNGCSLLDSHYQKIEIRPQDFDEDDDPTFRPDPIYEAVDPYLLRPLPFLIGSDEFFQSTDVGADSDEEDERAAKRSRTGRNRDGVFEEDEKSIVIDIGPAQADAEPSIYRPPFPTASEQRDRVEKRETSPVAGSSGASSDASGLVSNRRTIDYGSTSPPPLLPRPSSRPKKEDEDTLFGGFLDEDERKTGLPPPKQASSVPKNRLPNEAPPVRHRRTPAKEPTFHAEEEEDDEDIFASVSFAQHKTQHVTSVATNRKEDTPTRSRGIFDDSDDDDDPFCIVPKRGKPLEKPSLAKGTSAGSDTKRRVEIEPPKKPEIGSKPAVGKTEKPSSSALFWEDGDSEEDDIFGAVETNKNINKEEKIRTVQKNEPTSVSGQKPTVTNIVTSRLRDSSQHKKPIGGVPPDVLDTAKIAAHHDDGKETSQKNEPTSASGFGQQPNVVNGVNNSPNDSPQHKKPIGGVQILPTDILNMLSAGKTATAHTDKDGEPIVFLAKPVAAQSSTVSRTSPTAGDGHQLLPSLTKHRPKPNRRPKVGSAKATEAHEKSAVVEPQESTTDSVTNISRIGTTTATTTVAATTPAEDSPQKLAKSGKKEAVLVEKVVENVDDDDWLFQEGPPPLGQTEISANDAPLLAGEGDTLSFVGHEDLLEYVDSAEKAFAPPPPPPPTLPAVAEEQRVERNEEKLIREEEKQTVKEAAVADGKRQPASSATSKSKTTPVAGSRDSDEVEVSENTEALVADSWSKGKNAFGEERNEGLEDAVLPAKVESEASMRPSQTVGNADEEKAVEKTAANYSNSVGAAQSNFRKVDDPLSFGAFGESDDELFSDDSNISPKKKQVSQKRPIVPSTGKSVAEPKRATLNTSVKEAAVADGNRQPASSATSKSKEAGKTTPVAGSRDLFDSDDDADDIFGVVTARNAERNSTSAAERKVEQDGRTKKLANSTTAAISKAGDSVKTKKAQKTIKQRSNLFGDDSDSDLDIFKT